MDELDAGTTDWQPPSGRGWCTYELVFEVAIGARNHFRLRQCPRCSAFVQPSNEDHHDAWHDNLAEAVGYKGPTP